MDLNNTEINFKSQLKSSQCVSTELNSVLSIICSSCLFGTVQQFFCRTPHVARYSLLWILQLHGQQT